MKKIPLYKTFTLLSLSFLFGVAIGSQVALDYQKSLPILFLIIAGLLVSALLNLFLKNGVMVLLNWGSIFIVIGLFWYIRFDQRSNIDLPYNQDIAIIGTIIKPVEEDAQKQKITIKTENLRQNSQILVNAPHYPVLSYGDKVEVAGKLEKAGKIEEFDYGDYLKRYLIFGVIYQPKEVKKIGEKVSIITKATKAIYQIPKIIESGINRTTPEPQASLAGGILFGAKKRLPDSLKEELAITGLTHIIALSGYNITIIIISLSLLLASYFDRQKTFAIGVVIVALFVLMTGASSSVVRAGVFSTLILFGRLIGRQGNQTNLMLLAATIMVIINPYVLMFDIGFQLSFGAFAGLVYLSPIITSSFERSIVKYLPAFIKSPLVETLSAQIMVLPLIIAYFGRLSIIAPFANLCVLWIIPLSMLVALFAGIFGLAWWPIAKLTSFIAWPALTYIVSVCHLLAKIPLASVELKNLHWVFAIVGYFIIISFIVVYAKRLNNIGHKI